MGRVRTGREIDAALTKKGFHRVVDGKHIRYFYTERVFTHMSHGMLGSTIDAAVLSKMARQLRLTKSQWLDLIDCPLSEAEYQAILRARGDWY